MISGNDVVIAASSWIGTPFQHQARVKGIGVDCAGLVIGVAHQIGVTDYDIDGYPRVPDGAMMERVLGEQLIHVNMDNMQAGDVLLFGFMKYAQHLAIITQMNPVYIIHAYQPNGKVTHHRLDTVWRRRIRGVYRLPGVVS